MKDSTIKNGSPQQPPKCGLGLNTRIAVELSGVTTPRSELCRKMWSIWWGPNVKQRSHKLSINDLPYATLFPNGCNDWSRQTPLVDMLMACCRWRPPIHSRDAETAGRFLVKNRAIYI